MAPWAAVDGAVLQRVILLDAEDQARARALNAALAQGMTAVFVLVFVVLSVGNVRAGYGRYASKTLGPIVSGSLEWCGPVWSLIAVSACAWFRPRKSTSSDLLLEPVNALLLALFVTHYVRRVLGFATAKRKPIPLLLLLGEAAFCSFNGLLIGRDLLLLNRYDSHARVQDPLFWIGLLAFAWGAWVNHSADHHLATLRQPGETGYKIPRGGWFDALSVSCPNFLGEIVEWVGFFLCAQSWPGLAFAVATFSNIGPRGYHHHQWYREKFKGEYDALGRKAVIPLLW